MQLNGLDISGYSVDGNIATFTVYKGLNEISPLMDTDEFKVTDDGKDREVFGGYGILNIRVVSDDVTEVTIMRALTPEMMNVLKSTLANVKIASEDATTAKNMASTANEEVTKANDLISKGYERINAVDQAIEELAAAVYAE